MLGVRSSARPKLVEPTGFSSAARAELALAIAARNAAQEAMGRLESIEKYTALEQLHQAVDQAEADVASAKAAQTVFILASADGTKPTPPVLTVDAAREALRQAKETAVAAEGAYDTLPGRVAEAETALKQATGRVKHAAAAVMRDSPAVSGLAVEVDRLQREMKRLGSQLDWLAIAGVVAPINGPDAVSHAGPERRFVDGVRSRMATAAWQWDQMWGPDATAFAPWQAALAALQHDANAPLPDDGK